MQLRIVHQTHYEYTPAVVLAQHLAYLQPMPGNGQRVLQHSLSISPEPAHRSVEHDSFGNQRCFFSLQAAHHALTLAADSLVETAEPRKLPKSVPWETVRDLLQYRVGASYEASSAYTFASPYVPRDAALADYGRSVLEPGMDWLEGARALMTHIHTDMTYEGGSTAVNTPVLTALAQRKGVCQDFAHLMIGCLRSLGLPARYVSGYLLTHPPEGQPRLIGADASHAWVQVACVCLAADQGGGPSASGEHHDDDSTREPACCDQHEIQWMDFDPTNNRCGWGRPGEEYVTLAVGRDFGDVSPLRGVIHGGGSHQLTVKVTVAPPEELRGTPLEQSQPQPSNEQPAG